MNHYETYGDHKRYSTPVLGAKHIRRLDREVWVPGDYRPDMSVLEIGCGTGLVLSYLYEKGVHALVGVDHDPRLADVLPTNVQQCFYATDIKDYLADRSEESSSFDRIILFDVLEHFSPEEGCTLLNDLRSRLAPDGRIHLKVPNAGSPWGQQFQYGDLTHKTAYTPESLRQQAIAAGLVCSTIYPQKLGSPSRQMWDSLIHGLLSKLLTSPPEIWDGNVYAILDVAPGPD